MNIRIKLSTINYKHDLLPWFGGTSFTFQTQNKEDRMLNYEDVNVENTEIIFKHINSSNDEIAEFLEFLLGFSEKFGIESFLIENMKEEEE